MFRKKIKIKLVEGGQMPEKATDGAACFDVRAREIIQVTPYYYKIKLGIETEIPKGYHCKLEPRSGITDTGWGMANSIGIIDADYRGEWQVRLRTFGGADKTFPYKVGDRVAQFELRKNIKTKLVQTNKLSETKRGRGGHNSTGLK